LCITLQNSVIIEVIYFAWRAHREISLTSQDCERAAWLLNSGEETVGFRREYLDDN